MEEEDGAAGPPRENLDLHQLSQINGVFSAFLSLFHGAKFRRLLKRAERAANVVPSGSPKADHVTSGGLPMGTGASSKAGSGSAGFLFPRQMVKGAGSGRLPLSSGTSIPAVGFGDSYRHGADYDAFVLQNGFDMMDTAQLYGTEQQLGKAIAASGRKRGEIFISDKIYQKKSMGANTDRQVQAALGKLGTGYIDTYMVHHSERFIDSGETALLDQTW
jgi:hypothetical protein